MLIGHIPLVFAALLAAALPKPFAYANEDVEHGVSSTDFMHALQHRSKNSQPHRSLQQIPGPRASVTQILEQVDAALTSLYGPPSSFNEGAYSFGYFLYSSPPGRFRPNNRLNRNQMKAYFDLVLFTRRRPNTFTTDAWVDTLFDAGVFQGRGPDDDAFLAEAKGEPHLVMWDGNRYDFMGECDLVLLSSKSFSHNLGLEVHMRTTILGSYSYIEAISLKTGNMTVEVNAENPEEQEIQLFVDGAKVDLNKLPLSLPQAGLTLSGIESELENNREDKFLLKSEEVEMVFWVTHKKYLSYTISGNTPSLNDARGMMGTYSKPSIPLSRSDGLMEANKENQEVADKFSFEWQVQKDDPLLFKTARFPQWPQKCNMPVVSTSARRLRAVDPQRLQLAETACGGKKTKDDIEDCKVDIMATGVAEFADLYD